MTAYLLRMRSGCEGGGKGALVQVEKSGTIATGNDQVLFVINDKIYENHAQDARYEEKDTCPTVTARYGTGGGNVPLTFGKVSRPRGKDGLGERWDEIKVASTRNCMDIGDSQTQEVVVSGVFRVSADTSEGMLSSNPHVGFKETSISPTLDATSPEPSKNQGGVAIAHGSQVRRLTPRECERLQGFPDDYTNIRENCPDSPRYKALGNSWAVPCVRWIGKRINDYLEGKLR